jgi:PhzF family phenazine biosynthesis protein
MAASYDFVQLDVFTRTPLAGNPLAVFTDARGLTDKQMQALSREMNLSETTFMLPREPEVEATDGRRVRIFSTREELPFAGHPTLGTALYLYSTTNTAPDEIVLSRPRVVGRARPETFSQRRLLSFVHPKRNYDSRRQT